MTYNPRIPVSFSSLDATTSSNGAKVWTFPLAEFEYDSDQGLYVPSIPLTGANYEYDLLGRGVSPRGDANEKLRFTFRESAPADVDTDVDNAMAYIANIGFGKLWTSGVGGVERWAYARPLTLPAIRWRAGDIFRKAAAIEFKRRSDWFGATLYTQSEAISSDPQTIVVPNSGDVNHYAAIIIAKEVGSGISITNTDTGYKLQSSRVLAAASDWLKFDAGANSVAFSSNSGTSYAGDFANFTFVSGQIQLMVLQPGDNHLDIVGMNGGTVYIAFYPAFA